ncbi:MAG: deoxyguanosinetriphosphate triphosphohydrolase [Bacteroidales bacterium]
MEWSRLLSAQRFGLEGWSGDQKHDRTEFQRDYDRLIFSAPFRRLQNKTQVFPLPGSVFVHNRLTHSLEVACVGRSLGDIVARGIKDKYDKKSPWYKLFYECGNIVSAACLAHDLGNPPFGHSGEKAINAFFVEGKGNDLRSHMSDSEWQDLINFEGNANAFRLLTHQFQGRRKGGFALTYSTLASIVKYPYESSLAGGKGKFGFLQSEVGDFCYIAEQLGMIRLEESPIRYARHPLVYLVEAADDICYQIMDIEDSHKLKILTTEETKEILLSYFDSPRLDSIKKALTYLDDVNEQVAYLRSSVIGKLIEQCAKVFIENEEALLCGQFKGPLIKHIDDTQRVAYELCTKVAFKRIYASKEVLDVEVAGYQIIATLLERLIEAVLNPEKAYSKLLLNRVPSQYEVNAPTVYGRVVAVLDYISGMTDVYALDLYRKINGMSLPAL